MQVVILGAGYGGLTLARRLDRWLGHAATHRITLVDRSPNHQLIVRMHEVAAASIPPEEALVPIATALGGTRVEFRQAEVLSLDPDGRRVRTDAGEIGYDVLVVALGGETEDFGLPGIGEHTLPLRHCGDAVRLARHVERQVVRAHWEADPSRRQAHLTLAVGGGGYTGAELAGEMLYRLRDLAALHEVDGTPRVLLVEARDQILPGFRTDAAHRAEEILADLGVEVRLNSPVAGADPGALLLRSGERLAAGTIVWAGGVRANPVVAQCGLPTAQGARAPVDAHLRWDGRPHLYVIGDAAFVADPESGRAAPSSAQLALQQAEYLAHALYRTLGGRPAEAYVPRPTPEVVSLGRHDAVAVVGPLVLAGAEARILKGLSYRRYEVSVSALA